MSWYSIMQMQPEELRKSLKVALMDWEERDDKKKDNTI